MRPTVRPQHRESKHIPKGDPTMSPDKPSWEDEEQTIVSYPAIVPGQPKPTSPQADPVPDPPSDDDGATIIWSGETCEPSSDEYKTAVADGKPKPEAVDVLAWLAISKHLPSVAARFLRSKNCATTSGVV